MSLSRDFLVCVSIAALAGRLCVEDIAVPRMLECSVRVQVVALGTQLSGQYQLSPHFLSENLMLGLLSQMLSIRAPQAFAEAPERLKSGICQYRAL